ncbi:Phosphatidylethanolamine-binding protein PEBP [Kalmanozyma brasiliensis GHG001]|uniref:PEBP-like protein n=1 Tax=Kalmanozyma brasiliensis (strain GHG001) TaxID=1365824 RepID=V5EH82_KALBG|nr:Phosphatidylethanolamine-binding protein PEBP [Kalmanozyma brasiliensis GHG001]EST09941.1 Phosphatidylethanolamine-binding protein PEBP [Kalmanozyma brasiliensis GHG001]
MVFSKVSLLTTAVLALGSAVSAQSSNSTASYEQVARIQLTFPAADLTPEPVQASWLDIQGVLNVTFGDVAVSRLGDKLTVAQVQSAPAFRISAQTAAAANASLFGNDKRFTVAFLDAGVAGKNTSTEVFCHYLGNNFTWDASTGRLRNQTAARVAYGAPLPATNDGPHRYMQLVFQQFDNFTAPAIPAANAPIQTLELQDYYNNADGGLGKIVAANYIQIEVGQADAPSSTAAVNQASVTSLAASLSSAAATGARSSSAPAASGSGGSSGSNAAPSLMGGASMAGIVAMGSAALVGAIVL